MGWQHGDPHFFSTVHFSTTLDPVYSDYEDSSFVPFYHIDEDYDYPYFVSKISNVGSYTTNKQALIGDNDEEMVNSDNSDDMDSRDSQWGSSLRLLIFLETLCLLGEV